MKILNFLQVEKIYGTQETALREISFELHGGEFSAIAGPSGSGKTTILNLAAGLDTATSGEIEIAGQRLSSLKPAEITLLRRKYVGIIFQAYNLFPVLNALENVEYPLALAEIGAIKRKEKARKALATVGLEGFEKRFASELSGGQQQRVAVARAIVTQPKLILADEPTANLDSQTARRLLDLFIALNKAHGITFLFSSHDPGILSVARRVIEVADGTIRSDKQRAAPTTNISVLCNSSGGSLSVDTVDSRKSIQ